MIEIREIFQDQTRTGVEAMLALRPRWTADALVEAIDVRQRPCGYRLVGVFTRDIDSAVAVAGFRTAHNLAWRHFLYVDDLSTLPTHRGQGHADRLMTWLFEEARRLGCDELHLDSGVGPDRAAAHRLYMRHHLRIASHHFQRGVLPQ